MPNLYVVIRARSFSRLAVDANTRSSMHGTFVFRFGQPEEGEVPDQPRARVHPELQGLAGSLQEDERGQGDQNF